MPETDKREEGQELLKESSDMHVPVSSNEGLDAAAAGAPPPAAGDIAQEEDAPVHAPEITEGGSIGEFADNVVSGLEQAALAIHSVEAPDLPPDYGELDLDQMSEAFFADWGAPDGSQPDEIRVKTGAAPVNLHAVSLASLASSGGFERPAGQAELEEPSSALSELSELDLVSLGSSEGGDQPGSAEQPELKSSSLSELSDMGLASWGASEGVGGASEGLGQEEPPLDLQAETQSLGTLGGIELASAHAFAQFTDSSSDDMGKHDELADAVQSALLSIYGEQTARPVEATFQRTPLQAEKEPSSLVWNKGASPASDNLSPQEVILNYFDYTPEDRDAKAAAASFASPAGDGLTPQEVILNYFDYPSAKSGGGSEPAGYGQAGEQADEEPITLRPRAEPAVPLRRARPGQERPVRRPEWAEASAPSGQYSGPPSFPVPGPAIAPRTAPTPSQESSRLLGAAAIGLMGGIAIAASLAAFLIYGPHPATVDIPGIGSLRLDKDEQGYGRTIFEEGPKEPVKSVTARAPAEFTAEIFAADAVAVPGQPSPLAIGVRSQLPFEKTLVAIAGIPEGGRLNAGVDIGGGNWLVPPRRLTGLTINLPAGLPDSVSLEAQLLDSNARTPVSPKGTFTVRLSPAAAAADAGQVTPAFAPKQAPQPGPSYTFNTQTVPSAQTGTDATAGAQPPAADASFRTQTVTASPPQRAAAAPFTIVPQAAPAGQAYAARRAGPRPEVEDLIREGNKHMREGDILEARQFYQKAVGYGDPEAALAMGRSYDPIYFARIDKKNAEPDAAKAFDWYKRAMDAGASQTAMVRIDNLKHFLNE